MVNREGLACYSGRTAPRRRRLGRVTPLIAAAAGAWVAFQIVNLCWPRTEGEPWYVAWAAVIGMAAVAALGIAVRLFVRTPAETTSREPALVAD